MVMACIVKCFVGKWLMVANNDYTISQSNIEYYAAFIDLKIVFAKMLKKLSLSDGI